ncbi:MAG: T9SS type A sorting domain-containing protein, partial [Crocinitomicaceae bacterium]
IGGSATYSWNNGVTNGVPFVPAVGTTLYEVTGTNGNGCANTDGVEIVVNQSPSVNFLATEDTTCIAAGNVLLIGSPSGGTFSGTGISGNSFSPSLSGEGQFDIEYLFTDGNGCSASEIQTIVVEDCSSIGENELANVQVYPNPTSGEFTVELDGSFTFEVHDARGRIVQYGDGMNTADVNLSETEAGIYFLHVINSIGQKVVRVVKN